MADEETPETVESAEGAAGVEDASIAEDLEEIKGELTAIFHGQGQRITEFRVVVSQGLRKVQEDMDALLKAARDMVRRNEELLRDAAEAQSGADRFDRLQGDIDGQIEDLKNTNRGLGDDLENLRREREELSRTRKETTEQNDRIREEIHRLSTEIDKLEIDNDVVGKEVAGLQRDKDALQKEVDILQERRQELLSAIAKFKEVKAGLLG